jgi:hypothetical protein
MDMQKSRPERCIRQPLSKRRFFVRHSDPRAPSSASIVILDRPGVNRLPSRTDRATILPYLDHRLEQLTLASRQRRITVESL